jgi:hypothetical protein
MKSGEHTRMMSHPPFARITRLCGVPKMLAGIQNPQFCLAYRAAL